jgi:hypothetical protein
MLEQHGNKISPEHYSTLSDKVIKNLSNFFIILPDNASEKTQVMTHKYKYEKHYILTDSEYFSFIFFFCSRY